MRSIAAVRLENLVTFQPFAIPKGRRNIEEPRERVWTENAPYCPGK